MDSEVGQQLTSVHNRVAKRGWDIVRGHLWLGAGARRRRPNWLVRWRLHRAAKCFHRALTINPLGWQSLWALGKIHQRLRDDAAALHYFGRAFEIDAKQPDVASEAAVSAAYIGDGPAAVGYARAAAAARPGDSAILSNLALALLISGEARAARDTVREALRLGPRDSVTRNLAAVIEAVIAGTRPHPTSAQEIEG